MPELLEFRVTFGSKHAGQPGFPAAHPDGWLTVLAADEHAARALVVERLDRAWAFCYPPGRLDESYFPVGELGRWSTAESEASR